MENQKILSKKCHKCNKEITSLYKEQLEYNYNAHLLSCKGKGIKNE